jgi:2,3-bisphosphoglycerate-dependent phosphoglycerate mutase
MELLIVRHGLPEKIIRADGSPANPPLDLNGQRQATLLADYLGAESIDAIWSSPLLRAQQTAAPLAAKLGLDVQIHDGVAEWDRNSSEYIPVEELKATNYPEWQTMMKGGWTSDLDQNEFYELVNAAFEEIIAKHPQQRVVVTCHGGVINCYLAHILGMDRNAFFQPEYTSIHRVMASTKGDRSVRTVNEIAHLRGTGLLTDRP